MRRRILAIGVVLLAYVLVVGLHDMVNWRPAGSAPATRATRDRLASVADLPIMQLTHRGRKSGTAHRVTIWFVADGEVVYLTTMDRSRQWVQNVGRRPEVEMQIGGERFAGTVAPVTAEAEKRREDQLLTRKYWSMRVMDAALRMAGRNPEQNLDRGRGGFFRVQLAPERPAT